MQKTVRRFTGGERMDFPKRKQLRLKDYDYSRNNAYFITICTYHRAHLFGEITAGDTLAGAGPSMSPPPRGAFRLNQTHEMLEKWLRELENKYEAATIDSRVVMPDHIHFLLFIEGGRARPCRKFSNGSRRRRRTSISKASNAETILRLTSAYGREAIMSISSAANRTYTRRELISRKIPQMAP